MFEMASPCRRFAAGLPLLGNLLPSGNGLYKHGRFAKQGFKLSLLTQKLCASRVLK
jgi:hypothetical protein